MAMNAKERRKAARQQLQNKKTDQDNAAGSVDCVTSTDKIHTKEARQLLHEQGFISDTTGTSPSKENPIQAEQVDVPAVATTGERLNAKQRRLLQRKAAREEPSKDNNVAPSKKRKRKDENEHDTKKKRIHLTLFVGQLPFKATEELIRKHFREAGEIQLRMATDKKTGKFKGTAFIEVKDSKALGAALSRHHTLLLGRRINVELTASGGGNRSTERREKIDGLRKKQCDKQIEKTRALVQKYIDAKESKVRAEDVDERAIDFLSWFDYTTAKKALDEYSRCVSDRVMNKTAFLMGILKRFRQTDGIEEN